MVGRYLCQKLTYFAHLQSKITDLHNINAHTKSGENPLTFTQDIIQKWKYGCVVGRWQLPISNPKPDLHINAHSKFDENPLISSGNKMAKDGRTTDSQTDRHMDIRCETIIPCHYCVAGCLYDIVCVEVLLPTGSCQAWSIYLTTLLLDRLSPLSSQPVLWTLFRQKLTNALLESLEGRGWP